MTVLDAAVRAAKDLAGLSAPSALVGGLAVSVRSEPRNTRDVDFAVDAEDDARAEVIVRALVGRGYGIVSLLEHQVSGRLATVRLRSAAEPPVLVDLLFASSGIEPEVVAAAEPVELAPGLALHVARAGHLIAMKLLSRDDVTRPQDRLDLASLIGAAEPEDLRRAEAACITIAQRGYARGRDLERALRDALATWKPARP